MYRHRITSHKQTREDHERGRPLLIAVTTVITITVTVAIRRTPRFAPFAFMPKFPWRGAEDAPEFSGAPEDLDHYFADIEYLLETTGAKYTVTETIQRCIYYLDYQTADLWESFAAATWEEFKREVRSVYPGSEMSGACRLRDLEHLV